jgi:predicted negative regulator of RcsB-dependent stress response
MRFSGFYNIQRIYGRLPFEGSLPFAYEYLVKINSNGLQIPLTSPCPLQRGMSSIPPLKGAGGCSELRNLKIWIIFFYFLFSITYNSNASDFEINPTIKSAYSEIIKTKLSTGRAILEKDKTNNGLKIYLKSYADLIQLLITEDKIFYEQFIDNQVSRLEFLENLDVKSPYTRMLQAEVRLHTAFVKLKFGHEVKGSWEIIKAYKLLEANNKEFPDFIPNQKSLGLLHILIGSTPENYQWVANLLGLKGNVKQGLSELQNSIQKDNFWGQESQLIYYLIHAYILKFSDKQLAEFQDFIKKNPSNQLFVFFGITTLMKEGKSETALNILENRITDKEQLPFPFLEYLKAEILLQKGQYQTASKLYQNFLIKYKGFNFLKDTYYKLFLCYWLNNEDIKAKIFLEKVPTVGENIVESDKAASKFSANFLMKKPSKSIPQKVLMKARLAFDGGYYDEALDLINTYAENSFDNIQDRAEWNYRKGRIYQKMNNLSQAISAFERTIALSENQNYSFGASAALQLGYIFQGKNEKQKAKNYFEKAISFKKHEYKNSVDNKAKAALNQF